MPTSGKGHRHCKVIDTHHISSVAPAPPSGGTSLNYGPAVEFSPAGLLLPASQVFRQSLFGQCWE